MSAPEPKSEPSLESKIVSIRPDVLSEGQRALAAIVFTDTVDFSALMRKDEDRARRLVSRDLASMRMACAKFDGEVVKSTGDGLLMLFTSAVQAVGCALEIQDKFRELNRELPHSERLRHRIGIHLGDVIRQHGDVMGDGVNVAARLQAEGAPGGVCVSNTVYEVVQNRLPFYVVSRRAKKLKNVGTITLYRIAHRAGGFRYLNQAWDWTLAHKRGLIRLALIAAIISPAVFFSRSVIHPKRDPLAVAAAQLNPLGAAQDVTWVWKNSSFNEDDDDDADSLPPTPPRRTGPGISPSTDEDFFVARYDDMRAYDFASMRAWLSTHDSPDVDEEKLLKVDVALQDLFTWCYAHLPSYSAQRPLVVRGGSQDYEFWPAPGGGVMWRGHSGTSTLSAAQIPPFFMASLAAQLIGNDAEPKAPATMQLWRGLKYFVAAYEVRLPSSLRDTIDSGAKLPSTFQITDTPNKEHPFIEIH